VTGLLLDAQNQASGVFLRDRSGWSFLPRGALFAQPGTPLPPPERQVKPLDVQTALATAPLADAMRALILTDPRLRAYEFTSAARTADDPDLFFGTSGLGLVRLDAAMGQWEPLGYSLRRGRRCAGSRPRRRVGRAGAAVRRRGGITWLPRTSLHHTARAATRPRPTNRRAPIGCGRCAVDRQRRGRISRGSRPRPHAAIHTG
jgi:hypothetical protein